jgi:hypothetical protein
MDKKRHSVKYNEQEDLGSNKYKKQRLSEIDEELEFDSDEDLELYLEIQRFIK